MLANHLHLMGQIRHFTLPERIAAPFRVGGTKFEIIHLATAPGQEVDNPHGAQRLDQFQREMIKQALKDNNNNWAATARQLSVDDTCIGQ